MSSKVDVVLSVSHVQDWASNDCNDDVNGLAIDVLDISCSKLP